jgi:hypothetical protein
MDFPLTSPGRRCPESLMPVPIRQTALAHNLESR